MRSFLTGEQFTRLLEKMEKEAEALGEDYQVTYYFSGPEDLRVQKSGNYAKIWLKKGALHDDHREELEVRFGCDDFEKMEKIMGALGYSVEVKWFRERKRFSWKGIKVTLDKTRGYGLIIELEKLTDSGAEEIHMELEDRMKELGVQITPREVFEEKFKNYKNNWRVLTGETG